MHLMLEYDDVQASDQMAEITARMVGVLFDRLSLINSHGTLRMTFSQRYFKSYFAKRQPMFGSACILVGQTDPYLMMVEPQPSWTLLPVLSHEMIHFRDVVYGELQSTEHGILYKGKTISNVMITLSQMAGANYLLPFEQESHVQMFTMAGELLHELPCGMREYLEAKYEMFIEQEVRPEMNLPDCLSDFYREHATRQHQVHNRPKVITL